MLSCRRGDGFGVRAELAEADAVDESVAAGVLIA